MKSSQREPECWPAKSLPPTFPPAHQQWVARFKTIWHTPHESEMVCCPNQNYFPITICYKPNLKKTAPMPPTFPHKNEWHASQTIWHIQDVPEKHLMEGENVYCLLVNPPFLAMRCLILMLYTTIAGTLCLVLTIWYTQGTVCP